MAEPTAPPIAGGPLAADRLTADRLASDVAAVCAVAAVGIEVEGDVVQVGVETWALYGRSAYDGDVLVAEYAERSEAVEVLRLVEGGQP